MSDGQDLPGRPLTKSGDNINTGYPDNHNHNLAGGWDLDVSSQVLGVNSSAGSMPEKSERNCVPVNVIPDSFSDELYSIPDPLLDVLPALDLPRWMPTNLDENASNLPRWIPGPSPDEKLKPIYKVNDPAIKNHTKMIKTFWPSHTPSATHKFPDFALAYNDIIGKALPNFLGAKVTVPSDLKLNKWREYLVGYHDTALCDFLQFGWPIGYMAHQPPQSVEKNHPSAVAHIKHIRKFIQTELEYGALLGPFDSIPFEPWTRLSPVMTRSKKDSGKENYSRPFLSSRCFS